ncbi:hypothetical protein BDR04DRAFT_1123405 [Suillus decipiens]|nr:hypothetical protein BDR04DRAFT_1123405 [Suillus decipiens]
MSETQHFEKENVQTVSNADLFDTNDDMEDTNTESRMTTQFDTPQCTMTMTQPKVTAKGELETPTEVEQRLITKKDKVLKAAHQNMHWKNRYLCRAMFLEHFIKYKTNEDKEDAPGWQWLQRLVRTLGEHGMSSKESDMENDIETVLHVKNMTWCHAIECSKLMKWIWSAGNPTISRAEVDGLPEALYNKEWLTGLTLCQVERLSISDERFQWMKVVVV